MDKFFMFVCLAIATAGCNRSPVATGLDGESDTAVATNSQYLADVEPAGAMPVGEARQLVEDNEAVTLVGLIGGSTKPFVDGLAAFTIVDPKVPYCEPAEECPTPWDYCCQVDAVKENIATVKLVDGTGGPVTTDARVLLNVTELSTVVVQGTAKRDPQGNLTVAADKVFIKPGK